jgi:hypothetical protein
MASNVPVSAEKLTQKIFAITFFAVIAFTSVTMFLR